MKLNDVFIVYDGARVKVVPKSEGKPHKVKHGHLKGYYDPADWDLSNPAHFFLEQFTALTYGGADPKQLHHELEKIDEYEELEETGLNLYVPKRKKKAA